jgi:hypothetical protein
MLFKDIKQNYPIHIFDKQDFRYIQGKATAVSFPKLEINPDTGKPEMMVSITIEAEGKTATYAIPENLSVSYANGFVFATDKGFLLAEAKAVKANAEQIIASAPKAQKIIDSSPTLFAELDPSFKEKQETEQRFGKIEGSISEMKELMKQQQEMMTNFIKKFE